MLCLIIECRYSQQSFSISHITLFSENIFFKPVLRVKGRRMQEDQTLNGKREACHWVNFCSALVLTLGFWLWFSLSLDSLLLVEFCFHSYHYQIILGTALREIKANLTITGLPHDWPKQNKVYLDCFVRGVGKT